MSETQKSIADWAHDTFGPAHSIHRVLGRAAEECAELVRKVTIGTFTPEEIAEEAADTAIVLMRAAHLADIELGNFVTAHNPGSAAECAFLAMSDIAQAGAAWSTTPEPSSARAVGYLYGAQMWLTGVCRVVGQDIAVAIELKMQVNRNRKWKLDGSGHGYHERPKGVTL